jgi:arginase
MPLAENSRRNVGLKFNELMASLRVFLSAPNWSALTICELNPDHGQSNGATLRTFATALAEALT